MILSWDKKKSLRLYHGYFGQVDAYKQMEN